MTKLNEITEPETKRPVDRLVMLAEDGEWGTVCEWAESNIRPLSEHMETWGKHCGAPRAVYRGHIVRMLIDMHKAS